MRVTSVENLWNDGDSVVVVVAAVVVVVCISVLLA